MQHNGRDMAPGYFGNLCPVGSIQMLLQSIWNMLSLYALIYDSVEYAWYNVSSGITLNSIIK